MTVLWSTLMMDIDTTMIPLPCIAQSLSSAIILTKKIFDRISVVISPLHPSLNICCWSEVTFLLSKYLSTLTNKISKAGPRLLVAPKIVLMGWLIVLRTVIGRYLSSESFLIFVIWSDLYLSVSSLDLYNPAVNTRGQLRTTCDIIDFTCPWPCPTANRSEIKIAANLELHLGVLVVWCPPGVFPLPFLCLSQHPDEHSLVWI